MELGGGYYLSQKAVKEKNNKITVKVLKGI